MDKINEKIIDKLFDKYRYPSNGFDNLETNLQLLEDNILWNPMSSIDDIGFPKELLQNPARIRPSDEFLIGFERIIKMKKEDVNFSRTHMETEFDKFLKKYLL